VPPLDLFENQLFDAGRRCVEAKPARREVIEAGEVLDDRNAGAEERRRRRA